MSASEDITYPIRVKAAAYDNVITGTSCNQSSFKTKRGAYLFIGPGAKGIGYKAMFKLGDAMPQALGLADKHPQRFEVGTTGWVTARFTEENPLPESIWDVWLNESYLVTEGKMKRS